jgi:hypothetical protein
MVYGFLLRVLMETKSIPTLSFWLVLSRLNKETEKMTRELTIDRKEKIMTTLNLKYQQIIDTPIPAFIANIRHEPRKVWAKQIKLLLRSLGLGFVSVTSPHGCSTVSVRFHDPQEYEHWEGSEHEKKHAEIDEQQRGARQWLGYGHYCPWCQQRWGAHQRLEAIILAAYPDLNDHSDLQSDYFDFCFSVE